MVNEYDIPGERTLNFLKHKNEMMNFSIADIVRIYECLNRLLDTYRQDRGNDYELLEEAETAIDLLAAQMSNLITEEKCGVFQFRWTTK